ncbi:MAG: phage holin [Oscillospiraceae bacterium]|nr:phage holin [Oscillospiraceae bacterium]
MKLTNKTYDILKWVCLILLPALSTLYWSLSGIWGWPYTEQIIGTIAAVETFLGVIIGISTHTYNVERRQSEEL